MTVTPGDGNPNLTVAPRAPLGLQRAVAARLAILALAPFAFVALAYDGVRWVQEMARAMERPGPLGGGDGFAELRRTLAGVAAFAFSTPQAAAETSVFLGSIAALVGLVLVLRRPAVARWVGGGDA